MKLHPREFVVRAAEGEIHAALLDLRKKHDLTDVEYLQVLNGAAASLLKHMLRSERHPEDPDKPAGLA